MKKIFMATLLAVMMIAATALAASWQHIYTDQNDNEIYFDTDSVQVTSMTENKEVVTFNANFRMNHSERGRDALIAWYRDYSIMPAGIENLSYDISTIQFKKDGDKRYYYISERVSYTAGGSQIVDMHYTDSTGNWQEIPVASVVDIEYYNAFLIVDGKRFDANY